MLQRIGVRLIASFAILLLLMTAAGAVGHMAMGQALGQYQRLTDYDLELSAQVAALSSQVHQMSAGLRGYGLYQEEPYLDAYRQAADRANATLAEVRQLPLTPTDAEIIEELANRLHYVRIYNDGMTSLSATGASATASKVLAKGLPAIASFIELAERVQTDIDERTAAVRQSAYHQTDLARYVAIGSIVGGIVVVLALGFLLTRSITRPIHGLVRFAQQMAKRDLRAATGRLSGGVEMSDLTRALHAMRHSLREAITLMQSGSNQLIENSGTLSQAAAAGAARTRGMAERLMQLTQGWHAESQGLTETVEQTAQLEAALVQLAGGADEHARTMTETARLMQGVTQTVQQVSTAGSQVAAAARETYRQAAEGTKAVQDLSQGIDGVRAAAEKSAAMMATLHERSGRIGEISESIGSIAEQTSLLALNAAIEAARAGDSGRGFAVVAEEVGRLASRAHQAAGEIAELVTAMQAGSEAATVTSAEVTREAEASSQKAAATGLALQTILAAMKEAVAQTESIAAGVHQIAAHAAAANEAVAHATSFSMDAGASTGQIRTFAGRIAQETAARAASLEQSQRMATEVLKSAGEIELSAAELEGAAGRLAALARDFGKMSHSFSL